MIGSFKTTISQMIAYSPCNPKKKKKILDYSQSSPLKHKRYQLQVVTQTALIKESSLVVQHTIMWFTDHHEYKPSFHKEIVKDQLNQITPPYFSYCLMQFFFILFYFFYSPGKLMNNLLYYVSSVNSSNYKLKKCATQAHRATQGKPGLHICP